ncbi:hypothetical protein MFLO_16070 [Listeria floridensis FSL S10-1187]|uniref:Uncharacterized protein n=1 Tax=Listeria floridensis FSL S10-1187 TaxID=1265817 RepID=A0ABN0RB68_9LIST|nr:hypothetical protein [Listeria floridensis]EUJ23252.1 hypothetical protein MFLO_16070 [Listeria floridensis FSL S10-1187]
MTKAIVIKGQVDYKNVGEEVELSEEDLARLVAKGFVEEKEETKPKALPKKRKKPQKLSKEGIHGDARRTN